MRQFNSTAIPPADEIFARVVSPQRILRFIAAGEMDMYPMSPTAETYFDLSRVAARQVQWVWRQVWRDVLFLHWRVAAADLQRHIPPGLSIDTHAGDAWVSIVLFRLEIAPIGLPRVPGFSSLVEVNLRTYVALQDQPGIYFLSIHADNLAALSLARLLTPLPYLWANIRYRRQKRSCACGMRRLTPPAGEISVRAELGTTTPVTDDEFHQSWLLERYRAFARARQFSGSLQTAVVDHDPWRVLPVQSALLHNTLGHRFGLDLDRPPDTAHFCREMAARFSRFEQCAAAAGRRVPPAIR